MQKVEENKTKGISMYVVFLLYLFMLDYINDQEIKTTTITTTTTTITSMT
jgi:hypothetical protein